MMPKSIHDAILIDEVGLESARYKGFVLRTAYQPVFARSGARLRITAVNARTSPWRDGAPIGFRCFLDQVEAVERQHVARLCQTLHLDNHRNFSVPACDLFLAHDLGENRHLQDSVLNACRHAKALGESEIAADQVVCRIAGPFPLTSAQPNAAADELRRAGFRVASDIFEDAIDASDTTTRFRADIAEVNGAWLAKIAGISAAAKLLRSLVAAHHREQTRVFVQGISTPDQLRVALDSDADYFEGDLLCPGRLVGTVVDEEPKSVADLLSARASGQPLFA